MEANSSPSQISQSGWLREHFGVKFPAEESIRIRSFSDRFIAQRTPLRHPEYWYVQESPVLMSTGYLIRQTPVSDVLMIVRQASH